MSNPATKDLTKVDGVKELLKFYADDFRAIAPEHVNPVAFVQLALAQVRADNFLWKAVAANQASFIRALRECAALGHMPQKGIASLVPFNDKNAPGGKSIVLMEEWRGVVERMWRAGGITGVHVEVGREKDPVLRWKPTRMRLPEHEFDEFASPEQRGPLKAVYAWAETVTGGVEVVFLNRHEVARARAMSKSINPKDGPPGGAFWGPEWPAEGPNTPGMWRKTALHRLEGLVPTSAAYRWEAAKADAAAGRTNPLYADFQAPTADGAQEVWDAEIVDEPPAQPAAAASQAKPPSEWPDQTTRQPPDAKGGQP